MGNTSFEIDDVRTFWNNNPLLTGEIEHTPGTRAWFEEFDRIKAEIYFDDTSKWIGSHLVDDKVMLDVGCGPGFWVRQAKKTTTKYFGIDLSDKSVALAIESQKIFDCPGTISVGNAEKLEFPDAYFDHVLSEGVIHHTPDTQACVDEIFRVLKPGGTASIGLYYKNILLRNALFFMLCKKLMRIMGIGLKGRGRDVMPETNTPEEFVRLYDGANNPIGKSYSVSEVKRMFSSFNHLKFSLYYLPIRAFPFRIPRVIWELMEPYFGLMILIEARK